MTKVAGAAFRGEQMEDFPTLQDIARAARRKLPQHYWDYLVGGAESETTLRRNRGGLDRLALRPRVLRDVSAIDATATFLNAPMRIPVMLAPMGSLQNFEAGGALTVAKAAEAAGVISFISSVTMPSLEEVGAATGHPMIYQIYVRGDDAWLDDCVRRAGAADCMAVCFTVDLPWYGRRERDMMKKYVNRDRLKGEPVGSEFQRAFSWEVLKRFRDRHPKVPIVIKGIATAEDAQLCVEAGVEAVYVSNHGGRQLDFGEATIDVLPEVAAAVAGRAKIIVDGGIFRGTDVIKAIALGADAVAIGKLQGFGLAAGGQAGIMRVIDLLEVEIRTAMALVGVTRLDQLNPAFVRQAFAVNHPGLTSAYPLIDVPPGDY